MLNEHCSVKGHWASEVLLANLSNNGFFQDYKLKHKLKCRYVHKNNPRLLLKPAKEEEVYLNPWIVIYHDVVSDKEIDTIKRIATPLVRPLFTDRQISSRCFSIFFCLLIAIDIVDTVNAVFGLNLTYSQ